MESTAYGRTAVKAARNADAAGPVNAWKDVAKLEFSGPEAQKKSCPKNAFLGLCEDGLVAGVRPGKYTRSKKNKEYALRGLQLLKAGSNSTTGKDLWIEVMNGAATTHNHQCDVVLALWEEGLLARS